MVDVPEKWNELTPKQFIAAINMFMGAYSEEDFLHEMFGFTNRQINKLSSYYRYRIIHLVDFIQNVKNPHNSFFIEKLPGTNLFSPGTKLKGCCLQQFMTVDTYFQQFAIKEMDENLLNLFISTLYMSSDQRYVVEDESGKYNLLDLSENEKVVSRIDTTTKYAIFLNFVLIKAWLSKSYPLLFPSSDDADEEKYSNRTQLKATNWLEIFDSFVGDNIPQMKTYQAMPATDAFRIMNRRIREARKDVH